MRVTGMAVLSVYHYSIGNEHTRPQRANWVVQDVGLSVRLDVCIQFNVLLVMFGCNGINMRCLVSFGNQWICDVVIDSTRKRINAPDLAS